MPFITAQNERTIDAPLESYGSTLPEVLGATFDQALYDSPTNQLLRFAERSRATTGDVVTDPLTGEVTGFGEPPAKLDAETARARIAEAGVKYEVPDDGISENLLSLVIKDKRDAMRREQILMRAPGGAVSTSLQFATALGASILDPLNVASAFIPVVPQARVAVALERAGASALGRAAVRARVGAIEGAVGQAALEPLMAISADQDQIDYTMADTLRNIAFGAVMGSTLHTGLGAVRDRFFPGTDIKRPVIESDLEPTSAAAIVSRMNPETHQAAMKAAVAQAATGRAVDVDAVAKLDVRAASVSPPKLIVEQELLRIAQRDTSAARSNTVVSSAMDEDVQGVIVGSARTLDKRINSGQTSIEDAAAGWEATRGYLRSKYGDTVVLYRADAPTNKQAKGTVTAYFGDEDLAKKFERGGRSALPYEVKVDDIVAVYAPTEGYYEFIVRKPAAGFTPMSGTPRGMADAQPAPRDLSDVRAAATRSMQPESSRAVDMRAAVDAEVQLTEAPKSYDLEAAQKELTDVLADLQAVADQLGAEPGLKAFDDQLKRATQYEKALEAAAVCGARG